MILYKAIVANKDYVFRWTLSDLVFFSPSLAGAIMWGERLFTSRKQNFDVYQYKIPDDTMAIYNTKPVPYRESRGWYEGGEGIEIPIPLRDIPPLPPLGQLAIHLPSFTSIPSKRVGSMLNGKFVSSDQLQQAKMDIAYNMGSVYAYLRETFLPAFSEESKLRDIINVIESRKKGKFGNAELEYCLTVIKEMGKNLDHIAKNFLHKAARLSTVVLPELTFQLIDAITAFKQAKEKYLLPLENIITSMQNSMVTSTMVAEMAGNITAIGERAIMELSQTVNVPLEWNATKAFCR